MFCPCCLHSPQNWNTLQYGGKMSQKMDIFENYFNVFFLKPKRTFRRMFLLFLSIPWKHTMCETKAVQYGQKNTIPIFDQYADFDISILITVLKQYFLICLYNICFRRCLYWRYLRAQYLVRFANACIIKLCSTSAERVTRQTSLTITLSSFAASNITHYYRYLLYY